MDNQNAVITRTEIGNRGACIYMQYETESQAISFNVAEILDILTILEIKTWESLPGTTVRVKCTRTKIYDIGHIIKDQWYKFT